MPPAAVTPVNRFAQTLFTPLPQRYDRLAELLSMGQNARWHRAMIDKVARGLGGGLNPPEKHSHILDVASGTAGVALQLADRTQARVVAVDLTEEMLRQGQRNVAAAGRSDRISVTLGRAEQLPFADASFDALTFTYLLRYVDDPQATLTELARVVKPGGQVASLEFLAPPSRFWRPLWWLYTRLVLPLGGLLTGGPSWFGVGRFLGPSISRHYQRYPVPWTVQAWQRAGFAEVGFRVMSLGGGLVMWGTRAGG